MNNAPTPLTTNEALKYIRDHTGRSRLPHPTQFNRWRRYGWIERVPPGDNDKQNTYTLTALDALCDKINSNYRRKRNS